MGGSPRILGIILAPLMWIMGVPTPDIMPMGQLLGVKLAASEFVGYIQLAELKDPMNIVHLQYQKSIIMATYMLCGVAILSKSSKTFSDDITRFK